MTSFSRKYLLIVALSAFSLLSKAQEATNSGSGNISSTSGSVSFSVGLAAYSTLTDGTTNLSQGVQQAYEIFVTSAFSPISNRLQASVYPNPTRDYIVLDINLDPTQQLSYRLIDLSGKEIFAQQITNSSSSISMSELSEGIYMLSVFGNQVILQTFLVVKH